MAKKVATDQLLYAPVFTSCLFVYLHLLAGGDVASIPAVLQVRGCTSFRAFCGVAQRCVAQRCVAQGCVVRGKAGSSMFGTASV